MIHRHSSCIQVTALNPETPCCFSRIHPVTHTSVQVLKHSCPLTCIGSKPQGGGGPTKPPRKNQWLQQSVTERRRRHEKASRSPWTLSSRDFHQDVEPRYWPEQHLGSNLNWIRGCRQTGEVGGWLVAGGSRLVVLGLVHTRARTVCFGNDPSFLLALIRRGCWNPPGGVWTRPSVLFPLRPQLFSQRPSISAALCSAVWWRHLFSWMN